MLEHAADTVLASEPPLRTECTQRPQRRQPVPEPFEFVFHQPGPLGLNIERQRGWDRSRVTRVEGMAMQLGVQAGDVLTHANGQGLAKMAPKDIAKLLVPRPLKLHVQRYAPLSPAALPPLVFSMCSS